LGDEYNININAVILQFDQTWLDNLLKVFPLIGKQILSVKEIKNHMSVRGPKWMRMASLLSELGACAGEEQPLRILEILRLISSDADMVVVSEFDNTDVFTTASRIERIDRYLSCNYRNKVTLQDVSDYLGMNRVYFSMFFKTHYKEGFSDYLNRKRVEDAAVMLQNTDIPIPVIASECGFKTIQYFTRAFKKVKGVTPGEYRRNR
jgi:AraC-like DNA-binding protein